MKNFSSFLCIGVIALFFNEQEAHSGLCELKCQDKIKNCKAYECGAFIGIDYDDCVADKCGEFGAYNYTECVKKCTGYKKKKEPPPPSSTAPGTSTTR